MSYCDQRVAEDLFEALNRLVELQNLKDTAGKPQGYKMMRAVAYRKAKETLEKYKYIEKKK